MHGRKLYLTKGQGSIIYILAKKSGWWEKNEKAKEKMKSRVKRKRKKKKRKKKKKKYERIKDKGQSK